MNLPALLHSVSYSGSWGQSSLTLEQFIDKAADLGFEGVLLMAKRPHLSVLDTGRKERARLRALLEGRGLRSLCIAGYNNFTADLEHRDVPNFEIQVHYVTELARLVHDLGGSVVRIFTGYEHSAAGYSAQWDLVVRALKESARRALEFGVTLGVQNHHDIAVDFESQFDLIQAVDEPNCRAMFDAWAPALHGVDLRSAARKMGGVTVHTTVANYQKRSRFHYDSSVVNYTAATPYMQAVPFDEGFIDYETFLKELVSSGFHGSVAYEMCSPLLGGRSVENLDSYARRFLEAFQAYRQRLSPPEPVTSASPQMLAG
ncbi:MAG: sugar phosphate isomerase/epimerase family protein [Bryobacteraceae bacterium]